MSFTSNREIDGLNSQISNLIINKNQKSSKFPIKKSKAFCNKLSHALSPLSKSFSKLRLSTATTSTEISQFETENTLKRIKKSIKLRRHLYKQRQQEQKKQKEREEKEAAQQLSSEACGLCDLRYDYRTEEFVLSPCRLHAAPPAPHHDALINQRRAHFTIIQRRLSRLEIVDSVDVAFAQICRAEFPNLASTSASLDDVIVASTPPSSSADASFYDLCRATIRQQLEMDDLSSCLRKSMRVRHAGEHTNPHTQANTAEPRQQQSEEEVSVFHLDPHLADFMYS